MYQLRNRSSHILLSGVMVMYAAGCVPVKFIDLKSQDKADIGFEYYPPKAYLLVETTKEGKKARIVTLPDMSEPRAVKYMPIWGSAEVGFKVENGVITEFNNKYDAKGPETITALTGAATALAASGGTGGETSGLTDALLTAMFSAATGIPVPPPTDSAGFMKMTEKQRGEAFTEARVRAIRNFLNGEKLKLEQSYSIPEIVAAVTAFDDKILPELEIVKDKEPFKSIYNRLKREHKTLDDLKLLRFSNYSEFKKGVTDVMSKGGKALTSILFEQTLLKQISENPQISENLKTCNKTEPYAARAVKEISSMAEALAKLVRPAAPSIMLYEIISDEIGGNLFRPVLVSG